MSNKIKELKRISDLCGESIKLLEGKWETDRKIYHDIAKSYSLKFYEHENQLFVQLDNNIFMVLIQLILIMILRIKFLVRNY